MYRALNIFLITIVICSGYAQKYTHADSLRGSIGKYRSWWDVQYYNLKVNINIPDKSLKGNNTITFSTNQPGSILQIDLQAPLRIDSAIYHTHPCKWKQDGNAWMIQVPSTISNQTTDSLTIYYSGIPNAAIFPPWDGGFIWKEDAMSRPWVSVACQGLGASAWWPNKDHQSDEPDKGMRISVTIPKGLMNVSNGKLKNVLTNSDNTKTWIYEVRNPINNYDVTLNIGHYVTIKDSLLGKQGLLPIEYVILDYNEKIALKHLQKDTKNMLNCFEYWFGPYPFYEDGYRLVETPYLGMEHQSAIAYGNNFTKGYLGGDRSETGLGLFWDYIVVHESGHEWFGNSITAKDIADMWIQEGFTTYAEALFIECHKGKEYATTYLRGLQRNIQNDKPVIGKYDVNGRGSDDMYDKGANMIHTIRQIINNDTLFHEILLGLNKTFGKTTTTSSEIENYIISKSGKNLKPIFDQYLRTKNVPEFEYKIKKNTVTYRWKNTNNLFTMPVKIYINNNPVWSSPTVNFQKMSVTEKITSIKVDEGFYVKVKK